MDIYGRWPDVCQSQTRDDTFELQVSNTDSVNFVSKYEYKDVANVFCRCGNLTCGEVKNIKQEYSTDQVNNSIAGLGGGSVFHPKKYIYLGHSEWQKMRKNDSPS